MQQYQKALIKAHKRELKNRRTNSHALIWYFLKDKAFCGKKFNRQYNIGLYMVDFICVEKKLIIELEKKPDNNRMEYLINEGYKILHYANEEIFVRLREVLDEIEAALKRRNVGRAKRA